jgi:phospho-N-acetylmuramoyl-pentapeptide-transferase
MGQEATFALTIGGITFVLTVIWGGPLIEVLRRLRLGKQIRIDGPQTHLTKLGTPTMGGLMIVVPVVAITALLNVVNLFRTVTGRSVLVPLFVLVAFAVLGAVDDWQGVRGRRRGEGMLARFKFLWQTLIALGVVLLLYFGFGLRSVAIPSVQFKIDIGPLYIPIAVFFIVGFSNAVNITDGLDGLAGLVAATAFAAYAVIALLQGQVFLVRFCFTVVGACFAFLWFNAHPAELFMGDTGAQALGALLAVVALMTGQWLLLPIVAIIPVAETMSVILQVAYFKWSGGKRLFKMSPLHHHFELLGWSETQVVQRFWLVALLAAMVGIALALL